MSSRRKHHQGSSSDPRKSSGRDERQPRTRHQDSPLASGDPRMSLPDRSRARTGYSVLPSSAFHENSTVQPSHSVLPSTDCYDNSNTQPRGSVLPSANFRDDTKFTTAYNKPEDVKMAEKQRKYTSLPPAEQKEQDKWAHEKLKMHLATCPMGYSFVPWDQKGYEGYRCQGGSHLVTHALLAEGEGGSYMLNIWTNGNMHGDMPPNMIWSHDVTWIGPMYPDKCGRLNCAYPGGPSIDMITWRMSGSGGQSSRRDRIPYSSMMGGTGSGSRGSMLASANLRDNSSTASQQAVPASENPPDASSASFRTAYTDPQDIAMAEKQTRYKFLNVQEKQSQDKWAQKKLLRYSDTCPAGFAFVPWDQPGWEGYRCQGGRHLITHELLAEGEGGSYVCDREGLRRDLPIDPANEKWVGPLYSDGYGELLPRPGGLLGGHTRGGRQVPRTDSRTIRGYDVRNGQRSLLPGNYFRDNSTGGPSGSSLRDNSNAGRSNTPNPMPAAAINDPNYRANYSNIISEHDKIMAEKQLRIDTLSSSERAIQKEWAKERLVRGGFCPEGYSWWTYKTDEIATDGSKVDGYRCFAGGHMVTHKLLVEGKGRTYTKIPHLSDGKKGKDKWTGPLWPSPQGGVGALGSGGRGRSDERGEPKWKKRR